MLLNCCLYFYTLVEISVLDSIVVQSQLALGLSYALFCVFICHHCHQQPSIYPHILFIPYCFYYFIQPVILWQYCISKTIIWVNLIQLFYLLFVLLRLCPDNLMYILRKLILHSQLPKFTSNVINFMFQTCSGWKLIFVSSIK